MPITTFVAAVLALSLASAPAAGAAPTAGGDDPVRAWEEDVMLPTYRVAPPDPDPRFYDGRVYQGARASFYPYPVYDRLLEGKETRKYRAVKLENRYLRIAVLPELGGRILEAVDKSNGYDFFYRQHVVKPALIGMLGAWISGGVEWNVPHHHRATSFLPVDHRIVAGSDGSKTLWVGETEWRHRLRWLVGLTLRPGSSRLEMTCKVFNRTPVPHSFLFWINAAVHAGPDYQVVFPPSVQFAAQHGKPEFARWPLAAGRYGGVDYAPLTDLSYWRNHPSPVSFFAWDCREDFFGGYDHRRQAGVVQVADHRESPGKKFFEWGNGPEGRMWDGLLTDDDGPYLELMAGSGSDNQPDYSWIQPGEAKVYRHDWYPIRGIGGFKNANLDAAVELEVRDGKAVVGFNATREIAGARAVLEIGGKPFLERTIDIAPDRPFTAEVPVPPATRDEELRAALSEASGRVVIEYRPRPRSRPQLPLPEPVRPPAEPAKIATAEELDLAGLRLEQLHSPAFDPEAYYQEALRRDAGDSRASTALGIRRIEEGKFEEAVALLRAAVARVTGSYIRPRDGDALYHLGVALRYVRDDDGAEDAFGQAAWCAGWRGPASQAMAEIACARGRLERALELTEKSLGANAMNPRALELKAGLLRKLGRTKEAGVAARQALAIDPLDFRASREIALALAAEGKGEEARDALEGLRTGLRGEPQSYLELASEYEVAGLQEDALQVLDPALEAARGPAQAFPLIQYHRGFCLARLGKDAEALEAYRKAAAAPPDLCFPFRLKEIGILEGARKANPSDARAPYYLGCLLFERDVRRALVAFEDAARLDPKFAPAQRCLGLARARTGENGGAVDALAKAADLDPRDPRILYELDLADEAAGAEPEKRLERLRSRHEVAALRDDALTREVVLLVRVGRPGEALDLLKARRFHNWEGRGEIHGVWAAVCLESGRRRLAAGDPRGALGDFEASLEYPEDLEVARPERGRESAEARWRMAQAREALGDAAGARGDLEKAAGGGGGRGDAGAEGYFRALALRKLGREEEARAVFEALLKGGREEAERSGPAPDYFAKFGERESAAMREARGRWLAGLGLLGLGRREEGIAELRKALALVPAHLGAAAALEESGAGANAGLRG